ncbi:P-loop containing nucleoside triphosphate hydrolase protein [Russula brevipes]|nr:P-loop containing nucleoside triphosphate hydrolase protein [Russula brevipes]
MASFFQLAAPFLAMLNSTVETTSTSVLNAALANGTQNATATATPLTMPNDFSSLMTLIYSFSALHDYFKLVILGGAFETLRRFYSSSYSSLMDRFFITASFESEDISFEWMMFWLASLPQFRQFRDFSVSTSNFGLEDEAVEIDDCLDDGLRRRTRPVRYLPSYATSYSMWYKNRYMTISRVKEESRWYSDKSTLSITIFSRDRSILDSLILEARKKWLSARSDKIDIFASDGFGNDWNHVASRPKRPLNSIVLDEGVKELLLDDARDFLDSKQWYADRGIPFRRGYLLYGAPGSGKTSIIHSLAGELGLDIYIISLSKTGLDDTSLNSLISSLPEQCIAIMEDIDAAFTHGLTRETAGTELEEPRHHDSSRQGHEDSENDPNEPQGQSRGRDSPSGSKDSRITLSGLLNALDGISAQEGRLLFATTNRYHTLDPALTRPGRMDLHVEFRLSSQFQAKELYKRFYVPKIPEGCDAVDEDEDEGEGDTTRDSGYVTPTSDSPSGHNKKSLGPDGNDKLPNFSGVTHSARAPKLSRKEIVRLAEQFSARIPERELSMASLQGYLMSYKTRPSQAVDDIERWVKDTQEAQDRRASAKAAASKGRS